MSRYHVHTLGCRANAADGVALAARLRARGHDVAPCVEEADLIILNTCSVTHAADADARRLTRRFRRLNPEARIVVTGCLAERDAGEVETWGESDRVVGNRLKLRIPELEDSGYEANQQEAVWETPEAYPLFGEGGYTRAFMKVQDGCDARCSFCIIPTTRGHGRSVPVARVRAEVARLGAEGVREVVLTGIHLGRYGSDLEDGTSLVGLIGALLTLERPERFRISSLEPVEVSDELVALMAASPRLAPHFHVPLQSGSDRILAAMRRPYTARTYARVVEGIARRIDGAGIGADVMVGFPGESDDDFRQTLRLVRELPVTYLHVFRYSDRPGTPASRMPGKVSTVAAYRRSAELRAFSLERNASWRSGLQGSELEALTLAGDEAASWGLTGNYVRVELPAGVELNRLLRVRIGPVRGRASLAEPVVNRPALDGRTGALSPLEATPCSSPSE